MDTTSDLDMEHPSSTSGRSLPDQPRVPRGILVVGGAIVALVVLALAVVLVVPKGPSAYEPGSPEAAFQAFYQAYEAGDIEATYGLFSPSVKSATTLVEYRQYDAEQGWQRDTERRLVLLGTDVVDDRANLRLRIDQFGGGGLGGERSSYERTIRLVRVDGAWLIDELIVGIEPVFVVT